MSALGGGLLWGGVWSGGCLVLGCLLWGVSAPRGVSGLGGLLQGGLLWGVSAPGGVCSGGVSALGGVVSQHALRQTPPCEQNDRQVQKYYLGHNFIAAGNDCFTTYSTRVTILSLF